MKRKPLILGGIIVATIVLIVIGISNTAKEAKIAVQPTQEAVTPTQVPLPTYKIVYNEDNGSAENIYALIDPTATDEATAKNIAFSIQKKECSDSSTCNIDLFDNSSALDLQHQNMSVTTFTPADDEAWARKNYVFVADHYVGVIQAQTPNDFDYYYLKNDSDYQKYKNQQ